MPTHNDYQVGWICALSLEFAAAEAMLDTLHEALPNRRDDENTYVFGSIRQHNVVIACLPVGVYGTTSATSVGMQMRASFPSLRFCLLVGIAGGAPAPHADIRLGDVVVSKPTGGYGGVIQYDYGKAVEDGEFALTGMLDKPPAVLLTALARLRARHHLRMNEINRLSKEALDKYGQLADTFSFPGRAGDVLFTSDYSHVEGGHDDCNNCDKNKVHTRPPRSSSHPRVFYGLVASANQVLRSPVRRDALSRRHGILCFEMEAAGLIDILPCLVIRGICDYCDSHKNKQWQGYASLTAAAYAKELLSVIPSNEVSETKTIRDGLSNTNNMLPITPSGLVQTASMRNIKAPSPKPISAGFDGLSSDSDHSIAAEVAPLKSQTAGFLGYRSNYLVISIQLGYQCSTAAWTTYEEFRSHKVNPITSWPGRGAETPEVPTELGYKDGKAFWGYCIPKDTPRLLFLWALQSDGERYVGKGHDDRSARRFTGDYILGIYCHVRHIVRNNTTVPLGNWKVQVVLVVPSAFQSRAKDVESIATEAFLNDKSLPKVNTIVRSKAVTLGQLCMLPKPSLGAYVICDSGVNATDFNAYRLVSVDPLVLEEISGGMEDTGIWADVNKDIEDLCRQKLKLSSVYVNSSDLRQVVTQFREDILRPCFEVETPTRVFFIDIRGLLRKRGVPDNYTYEPYLLRGQICLPEEEITGAFKDALNRIKKFIDPKIGFGQDHKARGIVLAGSLGSSPYVYQRIKSVYTNFHAIPVLQEPNYHLPPLRGAIYTGFSMK